MFRIKLSLYDVSDSEYIKIIPSNIDRSDYSDLIFLLTMISITGSHHSAASIDFVSGYQTYHIRMQSSAVIESCYRHTYY